jgi:hypothetical protein
MTPEEMEELGIRPVKYMVAKTDIHVEWRGGDNWAVTRTGDCLNKDGEWEWEPSPSNRDDAFLVRCRFNIDDALRMVAGIVRGDQPATQRP